MVPETLYASSQWCNHGYYNEEDKIILIQYNKIQDDQLIDGDWDPFLSLISLYHTLFEPHQLSYGISVWGGVPHDKLEKLFVVQKKYICTYYLVTLNNIMIHFVYLQKHDHAMHRNLAMSCISKTSNCCFVSKKLQVTVHNLYTYYTGLEIFKILKFRSPKSIFSLYTLAKPHMKR